MPRVSDEMYQSRVAAQMLHGGGARWNSGNRWFDKTLQVSLRPHIHLVSTVSSHIFISIFLPHHEMFMNFSVKLNRYFNAIKSKCAQTTLLVAFIAT